MKERPVLFSRPMVCALLDGRKTQTRRVIKLQTGDTFDEHACVAAIQEWRPQFDKVAGRVIGKTSVVVNCPYGKPGDRLWVREAWKPHSLYAGVKPSLIPQSKVFYRADDAYSPSNTPWVPGIHMPRWASRLTLEVTEVRAQRLNDLTEDDAIAEGSREPSLVPIIGACWSERDAFAKLWEHINGEGSWALNPWVWAVTFRLDAKAPPNA